MLKAVPVSVDDRQFGYNIETVLGFSNCVCFGLCKMVM